MLDHLGWEKAIIMGHSMGGGLGTWYSAMFPEQVLPSTSTYLDSSSQYYITGWEAHLHWSPLLWPDGSQQACQGSKVSQVVSNIEQSENHWPQELSFGNDQDPKEAWESCAAHLWPRGRRSEGLHGFKPHRQHLPREWGRRRSGEYQWDLTSVANQ